MKRTLISLVAIAVLGLQSFTASAQTSSGHIEPFRARSTLSKQPSENATSKLAPALFNKRSGTVKVVVQLKDAPTAQVYADSATRGMSASAIASAQRQQFSTIERTQQSLLPVLKSQQATVIYRVQRAYNGIAVSVDASKLPVLAALPDVKAIHPLVSYHRENASSVPLIGAPSVWDGAGAGKTGTGIKIGIIDSGIDYTHLDFGGTGNFAAADGTTLSDGGFPTAKVVAGYDFAGDDYNADPNSGSYQPIPHPDPDPLDCSVEKGGGHGTHVAGTTAGMGVTNAGATYNGPYDNTTDFSTFKIGPGVAPQASLVALRVFGCEGSTDLVAQALDWAVDPNNDGNTADHLDVINMSLGSPFGGTDDTSSVASANAVSVGVIVVASAGNSGDSTFITGSPATTDGVISVASSVDSTSIIGGFLVNSPPEIAGTYPATEAEFGPDLSEAGPKTGDIAYPSTQANGCVAFDPTNAALLAGKIALIDRGSCTFKTKVKNAQDAGAIGALIANNAIGDPITMGNDATISQNITIPSMMTTQATGTTIKGKLGSGTVNVTLTAQFRNQTKSVTPEFIDTLSTFTSRGPRTDGTLKPDITAPGETIFSARSGSGNDGMSLSGTSMAAPHVAGAMALLKQIHPDWSVAQLKALAMNTATNDLRSGTATTAQVYGPARIGAGRIILPNAASDTVIAYNTSNPANVSVSFGTLEITTTTTIQKQITVQNAGTSEATFNLSYTPVTVVPGATYAVSPASLTIAGGASANATVIMTADPSQLRRSRDATMAATQDGGSRHYLNEASGYVTMTSSNTDFKANLRGYYEVPAVNTSTFATATATYNASTRELAYSITFSRAYTSTMAHIHEAPAGKSGPVIVPIDNPTNSTSVTGVATIPVDKEAALLNGGLYFNFHTDTNPAGEIRGQIVPSNPSLRVPVYANVRPASTAHATASTLGMTDRNAEQSLEIELTGTPINAPGQAALVSALELQGISPKITTDGSADSKADLQYIGVMSDITSTITDTNPTGVITDTYLYFGLSTFGQRATPSQAEFQVYIDTNRDNTWDYKLFTSNLASASGGSNPDDVFITVLCPLDETGSCTDIIPEEYLNELPASSTDTQVFNTNVMVLPIAASELGLKSDSSFNYSLASFNTDTGSLVDTTETFHFNPSKPGVDTTGGFSGIPLWVDGTGSGIPVEYHPLNYRANASKGILLLHHHNASGTHAEIVTGPTFISLPLIYR